MDQLRAMRTLLRVHDLGSFTAASRELGLAHGAASAIVADLEAQLGVALLHRTTRKVRPTAEGEAYIARARPILADLDGLNDETRGLGREPSGLLRVRLPAGMARRIVAPALPGFLAAHPGLSVEIDSTAGLPDFVTDRLDAAVFIGELPDRTLVSRLVGRFPFVSVASPDYLARHGAPGTPDDLSGHDCIGIRGSDTGRSLPWRFSSGNRVVTRAVPCRLVFEASEPAVAAAVSGAGVLQMIAYLMADELAAGKLVPVLTDMLYPGADIRIVRPKHRLKPAKVAAFEAFLLDLMRGYARTLPELTSRAPGP